MLLRSLWTKASVVVPALSTAAVPEVNEFETHTENAPGQWTAVVVDDSDCDRYLVARVLQREMCFQVIHAENGLAALTAVKRSSPSLVITDLQMPQMNGLELVQRLRERHARIPVVLTTGYGNERIAVQALQAGAASYVPKRDIHRELVRTVHRVIAAAEEGRRQRAVLHSIQQSEILFCLENDAARFSPVVRFMQDHFSAMNLGDETDCTRLGIALEEALCNALFHGNLELRAALAKAHESSHQSVLQKRLETRPYRDRRIAVRVRLSPSDAVYTIRDEGPGFDPTKLPNPEDCIKHDITRGRGLLLIRSFFDVVRFNDRGNQISMTKNRIVRRR